MHKCMPGTEQVSGSVPQRLEGSLKRLVLLATVGADRQVLPNRIETVRDRLARQLLLGKLGN